MVSSAVGGGKDGLNPTYTSTTGADGRHFQLQNFPLIANRTMLFKNGIPLVGLEGTITATTTFSDTFDYMLDITNGEILLQAAHLEDQGGTFYVPLNTNVGQGVLIDLQLVDPDAPPEIWTIRCIGVQRNPMNQPIAGTSQFVAIGSVSGTILDANGNPIIWVAAGASNPVIPIINLATAATYGVLASSTITSTGATVIHGDLGLSPGSSVTGSPTVTGATNIDNPAAVTAQSDASAAFAAGNAQLVASLSLVT